MLATLLPDGLGGEHLSFVMDPHLILIQLYGLAIVIVKFLMIERISAYPLLPRTLRWAERKCTR